MKTQDNLEHVLKAAATMAAKYSAYADAAEREGYRQVGKLLRAMAETQKVYAISAMRLMNQIGKTSDNLSEAIDAKTYDFTQLYPNFIEQANRDSNPMAAAAFQAATNTTKNHVKVLSLALENLGRNKDTDYWVCGMCGNLESGDQPVSCRICGAAREKFNKIA